MMMMIGGDVSQARLKRNVDDSPLGKRITNHLVAELGKRPREMYSFGIGEFEKLPRFAHAPKIFSVR